MDVGAGLAIGIPAAAGLLGVLIKAWPAKSNGARAGDVSRVDSRIDKMAETVVFQDVCQAQHAALTREIQALTSAAKEHTDSLGDLNTAVGSLKTLVESALNQ